MAFDPSFVAQNNPLTAPSEFKLLNYRTYVNSAGSELHCTREALQRAIDADCKQYAETPGAKSARYIFGSVEQLIPREGATVGADSPHMACGRLELRTDGLWAVDVNYHGDEHLEYSHVGPLVNVDKQTGALTLRAFVFTNSKKAAHAELLQTPWGASLYGSCAADFSAALISLADCVTDWLRTAQRPVTLSQVEALEERIKTHLTTMKLNAEMADSLRRNSAPGEA